jgi:hypothetical protein
MKLSLVAPFTKLPADMKTAGELSRFLINTAMTARYPQGMPRTESRIYAKLLDQFYENKDEVEIDQPTYDLVRETLDQSMLAPNLSSWKWTLLEHLDAEGGK